MAKKSTTIRVHQVAKEMGVSSKDIIAKCKDEAIPDISNHMSALSIGLAATVREWFSDSAKATTTVETAAPVDVAKVKKKAKKKTTRKKTANESAEKPHDSNASEGAASAPPKPHVPQRPEDVKPAGRRLDQPARVTLSGPKVIRVEKPEPEAAPRRRPSQSQSQPQPAAAQGGAGVTTPAAPGRERGSRRNKRRSGGGATGTPERGSRTPQQDSGKDSSWRRQDLLERENRLKRSGGFFRAARRDSQKRSSGNPAVRAKTIAETGGKIAVSEPILIKDLSAATGVKASRILKQLHLAEILATVNDTIDADIAIEIMLEMGIELDVQRQQSAEEQIADAFSDREFVDKQPRSPVVTILGHVDHGKTSLLDRIRSSNVADGEAGGITQATSAFRVPVHLGDNERLVTFIDTPGHEAFTEMRARGAKVTDIVVLVVAADDGVMPQTEESISHAKAAGVPIVVALNKIDKAEATEENIQRILGQLAQHELNPVEWGGDTEVLRTSAIENVGIQDLLEILDYQAELLELAADFGGDSEGTVIEAKIAEGKGVTANVLVQQGCLKKGDVVVVGRGYGRIRSITDDKGAPVGESMPSSPVAITGINKVPDAGDKFYVVKTMKEAEAAAKEKASEERQKVLVREVVTLDNIFEHLASAERKELPVIVKGDVQGSVETLRVTISKIANEEAGVEIKHSAVGGINESDVNLAEACGGIVVGFGVTSSIGARKLAEQKSVEIRYYDVIYDITDDLTKAIEGMLDPELKLEVLGHAEVREVFKVSKVGMIAGCYVTDGVVERNAQIRVTREGIVIEKDRRLDQLKRFKDDAKEVRSGQECGMRIDGYDDIKPGDVIECYRTQEIKRSL